MSAVPTRADSRSYNHLRPISISYGVLSSATGSCQYSISSSTISVPKGESNTSSNIEGTSVLAAIYGPSITGPSPMLNTQNAGHLVSLNGGDLKIDLVLKQGVTPAGIQILNEGASAMNADYDENDTTDENVTASSSHMTSSPIIPPTALMEKELITILTSVLTNSLAPPVTSSSEDGSVQRWYPPGSTLKCVVKVMSSPSSSPIISACVNAITGAMLDCFGSICMSRTLVGVSLLIVNKDEEDDDTNNMEEEGGRNTTNKNHYLLVDPTMNECYNPKASVLTLITSASQSQKPSIISTTLEKFHPAAYGKPADTTDEDLLSPVAYLDAIGAGVKVGKMIEGVFRRSMFEKNEAEEKGMFDM